jgi:leader peptidase (prepilin peptidase) / N-methyltransferase
MVDYEWLQLWLRCMWVFFVFAFGACAGSLINVLVYRLPLGLNVATVGSRCPACGTKLTWRENIPVLGWLLLRGRCRFCKSPISPEYPMVEALVGVMFAATFAMWYFIPPAGWGGNVWLGINWGLAAPEWARSDVFAHSHAPLTTWGPLIIILMLIANLVAMTLVDAKTSTIPLQLTWFATAVGIVGHTVAAAIVGPLREHAPGHPWSIALPGGSFVAQAAGWQWIGASFGGAAGIVIACALLHFGLIRRSFADYQEWEDSLRANAGAMTEAQADADSPGATAGTCDADLVAGPVGAEYGAGARRVLWFTLVWLGVIVALALLGGVLGPIMGLRPWVGLVAGFVFGPIVAAFATRSRAPALTDEPSALDSAPGTSPELWIQYPHARREMVRELLFLTPCIALALAGAWLGVRLFAGATPPFWLWVLSGTLLGYLAGGGLIWLIRIIGTLGFGKEAMGLGDVHMMAGVGACLGWMDATLAVPLAAFVGMFWMIVTRVWSGGGGRAIPFGPYLAAATLLILWGKPVVEAGLTMLAAVPPGQPGVNLP